MIENSMLLYTDEEFEARFGGVDETEEYEQLEFDIGELEEDGEDR